MKPEAVQQEQKDGAVWCGAVYGAVRYGAVRCGAVLCGARCSVLGARCSVLCGAPCSVMCWSVQDLVYLGLPPCAVEILLLSVLHLELMYL